MRPYDIRKDMVLTLSKYLEYCKTYIDFIDK